LRHIYNRAALGSPKSSLSELDGFQRRRLRTLPIYGEGQNVLVAKGAGAILYASSTALFYPFKGTHISFCAYANHAVFSTGYACLDAIALLTASAPHTKGYRCPDSYSLPAGQAFETRA